MQDFIAGAIIGAVLGACLYRWAWSIYRRPRCNRCGKTGNDVHLALAIDPWSEQVMTFGHLCQQCHDQTINEVESAAETQRIGGLN